MRGSKSATLFVASLACFMVILDTTVVNVAINGIRESLHASLSGLQWVIDGYALSFASLLLSAGALSDRFGPKRVFTVGLVVFGLTSLWCGLAPDLSGLVTARVIQGLGAALLIPSSLAIVSRTFTIPVERARALSVWGGIGGGSAMTAGPILGGLLTGYLGWRSVFLINVPVGILALAMAKHIAAEEPNARRRGLDLPGQITAVVSLAALTYLFIEGPNLGWTSEPAVISGFIAAAFGMAFFAFERQGNDPMLPLELFRNRDFSLSTGIGFALNFAFYGQLFFLNVFWQQQSHLSPQMAGLRFLPQAIAGVTFAFTAGRIAHRLRPAVALWFGTMCAAIGLTMLGVWGLRGNLFVDGLCMLAIGISIGTPASLVTVMLSSVETAQAGLASGALNASRQVGGLLGVAVLGAMVGNVSGAGVHIALWASAAIMAVASTASFVLTRSTVAEPSHDLSEALAEAMA
jgi:DHA2 family methylenomycin A resistance protein-like MFS transporter